MQNGDRLAKGSVYYAFSATPGELDPQTAAYLRGVEQLSGAHQPGIYVKRPSVFGGPRGGWWFFGVLGLLLMGVAGFLFTNVLTQDAGSDSLPLSQAFFFGLGLFFLIIGIIRYLRTNPPWMPGSYLYADSNFLWEVKPSRINAIALAPVKALSGTHHTTNGSYSYTNVVLDLAASGSGGTGGGGKWSFTASPKQSAMLLLNFLQCLVEIRTSANENVRALAVSPGVLGTVARGISQGLDIAAAMADRAPDPPLPRLVKPDESVPQYGGPKTVALVFICAVVGGIAGFVGFSMLDQRIQDDSFYADARQATGDNFGPLDRYLQYFPNGRHSTDVAQLRDDGQFALVSQADSNDTSRLDQYLDKFPRGRHAQSAVEMRDDRRFTAAQRDSEKDASPAKLRGYLVDAKNVRHRTDAQHLISKYYDDVIADLKSKQASANSNVDPKLLQGIVALLEGLKTAPRPVVSVGFKSEVDPEPKSDSTRVREQVSYRSYLRRKPELQAIADAAPGKTAIVQPAHVFEPGQMSSRESIIIGRLRDAVEKGIKADILTLEPVDSGEQPSMQVSYHIKDDGTLGLYSDEHEKVKGLLRWYVIQWDITFHPAGSDQTYEYALYSEPGSSLHYDARPEDPEWAIYSVVLYSGFYDMGAQLVKGFGQDPGPIPDKFSLSDAEGTYRDDSKQLYPGIPNLPLSNSNELPLFTPKPFTPMITPQTLAEMLRPFVRDEFWFDSTLAPAGTRHWKKTDDTHWQSTLDNGATTDFEITPGLPMLGLGTIVELLPDKKTEVLIPERANTDISYRNTGDTKWIPFGKVRLTAVPPPPATQP